ncbi:MAG: tryptophan synthase subunit alpha [Gammaproteobacteria bacterium]|nr:tryptophan synthase subunit alpha [Gammaproteobacteria bacterium]
MSRIAARFAELKAAEKAALIPFVTAGDPDAQTTVHLLHALVEAGADVVELGIPFSDPMADGPVIQRAGERALAGGMSLAGVLNIVKEFRKKDAQTPVVLMGYLNPIEAMGYQVFAEAAAAAGVDGAIVVDLPPEEGEDVVRELKAAGMDLIFLISPNTSPARIAKIAEHASGYLYYVSLKGVTGAANLDPAEVAQRVEVIKGLTPLPVGVGFGISTPALAASVGRVSDAVVVGSALVQIVEKTLPNTQDVPAKVAELIAGMRAEMDKR